MEKSFANATKEKGPHKVLVNLENKLPPGYAVEIGCGNGANTVYLIKRGWNVTAIDIDLNAKINCLEKLNNEERKRLCFLNNKFQEIIPFPKCNMLIAFNVLHMCNRKSFPEIWENLEKSIEKGGYFVGNIYGTKHSFAKNSEKGTFLTKKEIEKMLKKFEIEKMELKEGDGMTAISKNKMHFYFYYIIAKKR